MNVNPGIFKAYDIRGIYPTDLNEAAAYAIGRAFVTFLDVDQVLVGRDMRLSGPQIFAAVTRGIMDQGADVINIGMVSTDQFYFACSKQQLPGIMVTAPPFGDFYLLQFTLTGRCQLRQDGRCMDLPAGSVAVINPFRAFAKAWAPGTRQLLIRIDRRLLEREFRAWTGSDKTERIEFDLSPVESMAKVGTLTHYVRMLCDDLGNASSHLEHPLVSDRIASAPGRDAFAQFAQGQDTEEESPRIGRSEKSHYSWIGSGLARLARGSRRVRRSLAGARHGGGRRRERFHALGFSRCDRA